MFIFKKPACRQAGKKNNGFTLVEVLITLAIFSIITVSIFGIFSSSIKNQRYVLITGQLIDESNFTLDYMSKIIMLAKKYTGDPTDPPGCIATIGDNYNPTSAPASTQITFIRGEVDEDGNIVKKCCQFRYDTTDPLNKKVVQIIDGVSTDLTPSNIEITNLKFYISGGSDTEIPNYQPRITVLLEARAKNSSPVPTVSMQTTVSQRDIDIPY